MSSIRFDAVSKNYGEVSALSSFDLTVAEGEFVALLGPSGCGKTTALRLIAGFLRPSAGRILIDGSDVSAMPTYKRNIGMVFQDYSLFPHMTVRENIGFGLRERGVGGAAAAGRIDELLELVKLPHLGTRYPGELSGGQQQRIALARALAFHPRVLLMDEPFGALDLKLREAMQVELVHIQHKLGITTILVTHDQGEAMAMADRIAVMSGGKVAQLGRPEEIYFRPCNRFVADFVGKINLLPARIVGRRDDMVELSAGEATFVAPCTSWAVPGLFVDLAVRPECLTLARRDAASGNAGAPARNCVEGTVLERRFAGATQWIDVATKAHGNLLVSVDFERATFAEGDAVNVSWEAGRSVLLPTEVVV